MDNFEEAESKYGKIYKVAGPRKYTSQFINFDQSVLTHVTHVYSGRCRENVRIKDVRASQGWMG